MKVIPQTRHSHSLAIFVSIFILLWAYLMKVIPQTRYSHYIIYLRFYFYCTMSVPDEGYSTNTSTLYIFVSIFILLWAYLMKVIPQTRHSHYIIYLRFIFILLWAYLMKVIPQTRFRFYFYFTMSLWRLWKFHSQTYHSHYIIYLRFYFYFTMIVPDEGYSTNTSFALHYISSFLFLFYYERTWWRLFHKHVIRTTLYIFVSIFILLWAYLMKVIPQTRYSHYIIHLRFYFYITMSVPDEPQTRHSHYIIYLRFYFYFTMSVPDEGYSTNTSFALH